ncbi:hypothetical protein ACWDZ8_21340 [Streptomyces sp. NPDC003233]
MAYDDRVCRLARRLRPAQQGDLLLVVRGVRPVAVTGRVDDGDAEAAHTLVSGRFVCRGHEVTSPPDFPFSSFRRPD